MKQTILLIEDNLDIMKINCSALAMCGYRILEAASIEQGQALLGQETFDLIILDIILPDGSGLDFCDKVRKKSEIPILFLSALGENQDIVIGLTRGGDDYLPKPYGLEVLLARVNALLRRTCHKPEAVITIGELSLNTFTRRAMIGGEDILLTPKEFAILLYLVQNAGEKVPAEQLYEVAWGQPMMEDANAVRVAISRLRDKIESCGLRIETVWGRGYRLKG